MEKSFVFDTLPQSPSQLRCQSCFDDKDPYCMAAMAILALCRYTEDKNAGIEMLNDIKGPTKLSEFDKQFLRDRFMDNKGYLPRSYFTGSTPENNYTPAMPYTIRVFDNPYSDSNPGYKKLFITSGGADSPREIILRIKPSTGEWFLWNHVGLLPGIRIPVVDDPWA